MREIQILPTTTLSVGTDQTFDAKLPDFQTVSRMDLYIRRISGSGTIANPQWQQVSENGEIMYGYTTITVASTSQARQWDAAAAPIVRVKLDVATAAADIKITAVLYD